MQHGSFKANALQWNCTGLCRFSFPLFTHTVNRPTVYSKDRLGLEPFVMFHLVCVCYCSCGVRRECKVFIVPLWDSVWAWGVWLGTEWCSHCYWLAVALSVLNKSFYKCSNETLFDTNTLSHMYKFNSQSWNLGMMVFDKAELKSLVQMLCARTHLNAMHFWFSFASAIVSPGAVHGLCPRLCTMSVLSPGAEWSAELRASS